MSKQTTIEARQRVIEVIAKSDRAFDRALTKLLRPVFSILPRETQLRLARDAMNDMTAAALRATELWGEVGNVRVDGNECQVGVAPPKGDFFIMGRGPTWEEAFAVADVTSAMAKGDKKYDQVAWGLLEGLAVARMALQSHLDPKRALEALSPKSLGLLKKECEALTSLLASVSPQSAPAPAPAPQEPDVSDGPPGDQ